MPQHARTMGEWIYHGSVYLISSIYLAEWQQLLAEVMSRMKIQWKPGK